MVPPMVGGPVIEISKLQPHSESRRLHIRGFTLVELLVVIALLGGLLAAALAWDVVDRWSLVRATRLAESQLSRARLHALSGRRKTEVRSNGQWLELWESGSGLVARLDLGTTAGLADSIRLRPAVIRFNARGHGSPGSLYLYRGRRGMRVISNFLGRVRSVPFRT